MSAIKSSLFLAILAFASLLSLTKAISIDALFQKKAKGILNLQLLGPDEQSEVLNPGSAHREATENNLANNTAKDKDNDPKNIGEVDYQTPDQDENPGSDDKGVISAPQDKDENQTPEGRADSRMSEDKDDSPESEDGTTVLTPEGEDSARKPEEKEDNRRSKDTDYLRGLEETDETQYGRARIDHYHQLQERGQSLTAGEIDEVQQWKNKIDKIIERNRKLPRSQSIKVFDKTEDIGLTAVVSASWTNDSYQINRFVSFIYGNQNRRRKYLLLKSFGLQKIIYRKKISPNHIVTIRDDPLVFHHSCEDNISIVTEPVQLECGGLTRYWYHTYQYRDMALYGQLVPCEGEIDYGSLCSWEAPKFLRVKDRIAVQSFSKNQTSVVVVDLKYSGLIGQNNLQMKTCQAMTPGGTHVEVDCKAELGNSRAILSVKPNTDAEEFYLYVTIKSGEGNFSENPNSWEVTDQTQPGVYYSLINFKLDPPVELEEENSLFRLFFTVSIVGIVLFCVVCSAKKFGRSPIEQHGGQDNTGTQLIQRYRRSFLVEAFLLPDTRRVENVIQTDCREKLESRTDSDFISKPIL
mmetsp:Transcript_37702/g.42708  ORF Transcript_37702/g.42708 Transcript_37702/m.42708 type:complete len:580 (+) Transcript_37702:53-1792(+)|eukprot:CAMPEP_0115000514 /NCGR_PEP_ID=MMETSP0216-20121206/16805_1 /TAXON_ID=223996 /ORGANISM="Protocruzia adherens, Strain Boccale" /LENGTH=579 /DNA_ID=CAMNT_0002365631 /DNA_START=30 /DNA_END=1769 /DNA_ORIENTATION=-